MTVKRLFSLLAGMTALAGFNSAALAKPASHPQPNIVLIVMDDTGYSDFGAFGSEIRTPNIDALAAGGLRYTRFESRAICSPTRASLLTGRNNHSIGMADLTATKLSGGGTGKDSGILAANAQTLPQALRAKGYATYAIGKWHLAPDTEDGAAGNNGNWPLQRGFDYFYGFLPGWDDQYQPTLAEDNRVIGKPTDPAYHFSRAIVDKAVEKLNGSGDKPAFLYLAFGATHAPIQVPAAYIDRYAGIYEQGWDAIRAERLARQKRLGIVPADTMLPPANPGDRAWASLNPVEKQVYARYMATYAGFLEHADEQIGRLIQSLKASGRYDNTLFILLSDNGAGSEGGARGAFGKLYPPNHPDPAGLVDKLPQFGKALIEYQRPWAMASVSPLRRYKAWPYAGGIRTPMIVSWPGHIADPGGIRRQFVDAIDIAPTLAQAAGASFATQVDGQRQIPVAGRSFAGTIASAAAPDPRAVQYFELRGNRAIRQGRWRAVSVHKLGQSFDADTWSLFDTDRDFAEADDVAAQHPAVVARLKALWQQEAARYGALPLSEGPDYVRKLDRYRDEFLAAGDDGNGN